MSNEILSFKEIFKLFLEASGSYKNEYKKYMLFHIISFVALGIIYAMFVPLLCFAVNSKFKASFICFIIIVLAYLIFGVFKYKAMIYDQGGKFVDVGKELRIKLGKKLMSVPLSTIDRYKTGEINSMFSTLVDDSVMFLAMIPAMFLELFIVSFITIIATFFVSFELGILLLLTLPLSLPLYNLKRKKSINEKIRCQEANAKLESETIEYIQGIGVLKSLNRVGKNSATLQKSIKDVRNIQETELINANLVTLLMGVLITLIMSLAIILGSNLVINNKLEAVLLAGVILMLSRVSEPLSVTLGAAPILDLAQNAFRKTTEFLNLDDIKVKAPAKNPTKFDIEFENVTFSYDGKKNALSNVSFKIPQNSLTTIVGTSGSGKTTITKLLMRYSNLKSGVIKIGGVDINSISQEDLMSFLTIVFQDVYLFNDTIYSNIKIGNQNASDDEIKNATKLAYCYDFIENLKDGFDTNVGDIGKALSGGEKQRISIARAILKNSPIIILDEFTSNLDVLGQNSVENGIKSLIKDKTTIIITHNLNQIKNADNILVFDDSNLVESGTHESLMAKKGKYYTMYNASKSAKIWKIKG